MAAPTFDSGDITSSGDGSTISNNPSWSYPAYGNGDLLIAFMVNDNDLGNTPPTTGPNGETLEFTAITGFGSGAGPTIGMIAWVGTASQTQGTDTWAFGGTEEWRAQVIKIPSGEFDSVTPIDSESTVNGGGPSANIVTPTWSAVAAGGRVICGLATDSNQTITEATGWTMPVSDTGNSVGMATAYRDAETTLAESIPSANFALSASDTYASLGLVVNGVAGGDSVPLSVFQNANQVIS